MTKALLLVMMMNTIPAPAAPPVAPKREMVDTYHGVKISDPYRWMEDLKNPELLGWMKGQTDYAKNLLEKIPGRKALLERVRELDQGAPYMVSDFMRLKDGTIYYQKLVAGAEMRVVCSRKSGDAPEVVVIDPKWYEGADGSHAHIEFYSPSPDGKLVVVGISKGGSEVTTIFVRDVAAGKDLPHPIDRAETAYNSPQWLPDGSAFLYCRRQKLPEGAPASDTYKNTICYLQKPGKPPEEGTPIFGVNLHPDISFAPMDFPSVVLFSGSEYVIGQIHHGDGQELTLYTARLDALGQKVIPWKKVCDVKSEVRQFNVRGENGYLVTSKDAPRFKVVRVPLKQPDFAKAEVVFPESDLVPTSVEATKSALLVNTTKDGTPTVVQIDPAGKQAPKRLAPPGGLAGRVAEANANFDDVFLLTESWTKGGGLFRYDTATGKFEESTLQPHGKFDAVPGYTSVEVEVKSHDGVMVPLSIIHKEGLVLDGSHPVVLGGYGAYGSIRSVSFNPISLAWLERGGVLAVAHVRGGGERGRAWHFDGRQTTKPNTWKDLIACSEYLIAKKYTSAGKLAIQGGSAGGILVGRAMTERPDLFRAVIIQVGCTDMLRFETTENGPPNIEELGSTATPEGFKSLLAMSTLHQVKDGVKYPAVLLTHGLNDRRVDAWMSAKTTARLQEATGSGRPVLLLVDMEAGHGIGSMRSQVQEEVANRWSFLLWQMGEAGFQP